MPVLWHVPDYRQRFSSITIIPQCAVQNISIIEPSQDQQRIARYHLHEAAILRRKAQDVTAQALQYERLFGPNSDWVVGLTCWLSSMKKQLGSRNG